MDHEAQYHERYSPVRPLDSSGPIEFHIPPSSYDLTDLRDSYLNIRVRLLKEGDAPVEHVKSLEPEHYIDPENAFAWDASSGTAGAPGADSSLSCANNLFHTLFSKASVYLNETLVESQDNYQYVAYVGTLFNWNEEAKLTCLRPTLGWIDDAPLKFDKADNPAFRSRIAELLLNGRELHLKARLNLAVFETETAVPNHCSIRIVLHRSPPSFPLVWTAATAATSTYGFKFTGATMEIKRIKLIPSALKAAEAKLNRSLVRYPLTMTRCRSFNLSAGQSTVTLSNMFTGKVVRENEI